MLSRSLFLFKMVHCVISVASPDLEEFWKHVCEKSDAINWIECP